MSYYYVANGGSDSTGDGSYSSPWATINHACSEATTAGDIIYIRAGSYTISSQCSVSAGVSLHGENKSTTTVHCRVGSTNASILLSSGSPGTNGNQYIQGLTLDGDSYVGDMAIHVQYRSNVIIRNCTIKDFDFHAIKLYGGGNATTEPTTWSEGNQIYSCLINNCGQFHQGSPDPKDDGEGYGYVLVDGQEDCQIYNNEFIGLTRGAGYEGFMIKGVAGWNKGLKIYNNTFTKSPMTKAVEDITWDFIIELWNSKGGQEIYGNFLSGGAIDISGGGGQFKGTYTYSNWIHDNVIVNPSLSDSENTVGIFLETCQNDVIVEKNYVENVASAIRMPTYSDWKYGNVNTITNILIRYNIFNNIGNNNSGTNSTGVGIHFELSRTTDSITNLQVYNNVFIAYQGNKSTYIGIMLPCIGTASYVYIRNNIIQNFDVSPIYGSGAGGQTVDYLYVQNNIMYGNGNSNDPYYASLTPTHYTIVNNKKSNPLFVSSTDFHISPGSPAIGAGIHISTGLTDFDDVAVGNPPAIGAYEYATYSNELVGASNGSSTVTGFLGRQGYAACRGVINGVATVTGSFPGIPIYPSGVSNGSSEVTGRLGRVGWVSAELDFTLADVCLIVVPDTDDLTSCFEYAIDGYFDPRYEGDHDRLSNFRNYGPRGPYVRGISNGASTVSGTLVGTGTLAGISNGVAIVIGTLSKQNYLMGVIDGVSIVTGRLSGATSLAGISDGSSIVTGRIRGQVVRLRGVINAGAGRQIGPYIGSTYPLYSHDGTNGRAYGFSFVSSSNFYLSKFGGYISRVGSPDFVITFRLATANTNGTPNTNLAILGTVNASVLSTNSTIYWYFNSSYELTAGTRYVIYTTYSSIVTNNATNRVMFLYVPNQDTDCNIVSNQVGPYGQPGSWSLYTTGELNYLNIFLGGVIGTLTPKYYLLGVSNGVATVTGTLAFVLEAPTLLTATAITDTQIDLSWTDNETVEEGYSIERSTDGVNFTEIDTVYTNSSGGSSTYSATGLSPSTRYYFRVRAFYSTTYSGYSNTADDWTAMKFILTKNGDGTARVTFAGMKTSSSSVIMTIDGDGKFYSSGTGTSGESSSKTITTSNTNVYAQVNSGSSNVYIFAKNLLMQIGLGTGVGALSGGISSTSTNAPLVQFTYSTLADSLISFGISLSVQGNTYVTGNISDFPSNLENLCLLSGFSMTGSIADFSESLTFLYIGSGTYSITGTIADLPSGLTLLGVGGTNAISGDIAALPITLTNVQITGNNTITGDLADLPQGILTSFYIVGNNTIYGEVSDLDYSGSVLVTFRILGNNEVNGIFSDIPSSIDTFEIGGNYHSFDGDVAGIPSTLLSLIVNNGLVTNSITGDVADITASLTQLYIGATNSITGDVADLPSTLGTIIIGTGNTLSGNIGDITNTATSIQITGSNTISGDISGMPSSATYLLVYGNNTISGDIGNFASTLANCYITGSNTLSGNISGIKAAMRVLDIQGNNTISGALSGLPSTVISFRILGANTVSGSLSDISNSITSFILEGNNTVDAYTSGKTWSNSFSSSFTCKPVSPGGLSATEIDNLFIDLDTSWTTTRSQIVDMRGTNAAPTSTSSAARTSLINKGRTIHVNT